MNFNVKIRAINPIKANKIQGLKYQWVILFENFMTRAHPIFRHKFIEFVNVRLIVMAVLRPKSHSLNWKISSSETYTRPKFEKIASAFYILKEA